MTAKPTTLVQTVGTSILANLEGATASTFERWLGGQPDGDRANLRSHRSEVVSAADAAANQRWEEAAARIAVLPGCPRALGAEIASLRAIMAAGAYAALRSVLLLHSDTPAGRGAAAMLGSLIPARFGLAVEAHRIGELQDEHAGSFKVLGLRNLIRELAGVVRARGAGDLVIDATGGFKAEVATAVLFGQSFHIPVLYLFERFAEIIEFPPLPLTVDLSLVERHRDLIEMGSISTDTLRERFGPPLSEANAAFAAFSVCLVEPWAGERSGRFTVSPMGQLLLELWRSHRTEAS
jgi:putative CRISPR-associated protein (TIGR02619 family)